MTRLHPGQFYFRFMQKYIQNNIGSSTVYQRFKQIPLNAYSDYYAFYRVYYSNIAWLPWNEYLEIKFKYIVSLYYLDKYQRFYHYADQLIEELLNGTDFDSFCKNLYTDILWYKAEAFRNERKLKDAQDVYAELLKMYPENKRYKQRLFYIFIQNEQVKNHKKIAYVVFLIILSLVCSTLALFVVKPFFAESLTIIHICRNVFFLGGLSYFIILQSIQIKEAMRKIRAIA